MVPQVWSVVSPEDRVGMASDQSLGMIQTL